MCEDVVVEEEQPLNQTIELPSARAVESQGPVVEEVVLEGGSMLHVLDFRGWAYVISEILELESTRVFLEPQEDAFM